MKTYFDPHPGMGGAVAPLPEDIRQVAAVMDGHTYPDSVAYGLLEIVLPEGYSLEIREYSDNKTFEFLPVDREKDGDGMVILRSAPQDVVPRHEWRVLKWKWA